MVINFVLYSTASSRRIVSRVNDYFSSYNGIRVCDNTLWLNNMNFKFYENLVTVNVFKPDSEWRPFLTEFLSKILYNEEVYVSSDNGSKYFEEVSPQTDFISILN